MKIKDIQIEGFGVWSGLNVDSLPDGMTVFYGPNEAGKTTLMQFLRAMLYGFTPDRRSRYLPPVHGGRPGGAIRVTGPGGGYEIARRAQLNDPGVIGQLTVTSGDGITQGQHRLAMLLGQVDESIFTNVFAIGLRELQELSTLDDTAAADELYKLSSGLDRVSLVDVIRQLRNARGQIVGPNPEQGQMQGLMLRREKLRDEQEQLIARGKRWSELAAQKKSHQQEIEELEQRKEQWEGESKIVEVSMQVREPWANRERIRTALSQLNARIDLPDDSGQRLRDLIAELEDRREKLGGVRDQRVVLRNRARQLPLRRSILELSSKIEAATEQGPWISALQKQIQRLESDIGVTREQLLEDAKRLGVSEDDQNALLNDKRMANLPDLSRQAITQLAGPAREVRIQSAKLKQAKLQGENDRKEADRLQAEIQEFLAAREQTDLHEAMQHHTDLIARIRAQQQIEEKLEKLQKHKKELQEEAADLEAEDALPMERFFVLMIPFVFGAVTLLIGIDRMSFGYIYSKEPATGALLSLVGVVVLFFWYTWKNFTERGTGGDLNDCEGQLDGIIRQIRKTEQERDELTRNLPAFTGTAEQRLREYEHELQNFEAMLPVHHNLDAASQRFKSARRRAKTASESLRTAKAQWKKTLQQLGLAESLSPKSIRIMAEGYESLLQTRKRLKSQEDELDQRRLELASITQRIDALMRQADAAAKQARDGDRSKRKAERDERVASREERSREDRQREDRPRKQDPSLNLQRVSAEGESSDPMEGAASALNDLTAMLAEQQAYVQQRRQFKEEDAQLAKQQKQIQRAIDRLTLAKQALLADLGVENQEQLEKHLDTKREYQKLLSQIEELDDRIRTMIGGHVSYDMVARNLDGGSAHELDKRWDALQQRIEQAEQRILQLHQRQGEISQEMKSLAADRRLMELRLELSVIDEQLKACAAHWQSLAGTTCMLEKVCEVYETERQPETLREASSFLKQLTEGKYVRVWTPLGKNALRIDNQQGQSLPLEVLSRGTREAVFIALRLSLAAAYARRGVMLPLVLDDVLVNFDTIRARQAAKVLRDYADLGNQVIMFTCHEHIMRMFHDISVQVRVLPTQGIPGEARVYVPEILAAIPPERIVETVFIQPEPILDPPPPAVEPVVQIVEPIVEPPKPEPMPIIEPVVEFVRVEVPAVKPAPLPEPAPIPTIDHLWYELDPVENEWTEIATTDVAAEHPNADSDPEPQTNPWWSHV